MDTERESTDIQNIPLLDYLKASKYMKQIWRKTRPSIVSVKPHLFPSNISQIKYVHLIQKPSKRDLVSLFLGYIIQVVNKFMIH